MMSAKDARKAIRQAKRVLGAVMPASRHGDPERCRISKELALNMLTGIPDDEQTNVQWGPVENGWEPGTLLIC